MAETQELGNHHPHPRPRPPSHPGSHRPTNHFNWYGFPRWIFLFLVAGVIKC